MKPIKVPADVAVCPICKSPIWICEVNGVTEQPGGTWVVDEFMADCETEPDIESDEWNDWQRSHWSTPYIDWLPVLGRVELWLQQSFTVIDETGGGWELKPRKSAMPKVTP